MILHTLPRKFVLAIFIAFGSIAWLSKWHQYVYTRSRVDFPPVSNWARDSIIVLLPVLLAIWISVALTEWIINRSNGRMSLSTQSILMAAVLGGMTSAIIVLIESNRSIGTGIGNEFIFLASICNRVYPNGNLLLSTLKWAVPGAQALRLHILLRDGANLMLFNMATTLLLIMLMEGFAFVRFGNAYAHETR
ncbi:MAG: hypothetical protein HZB18_17935 [Chloroflexi bacterium]|nr:hypothetical protein [Chloroflexota bacterium]